MRSPAARPCASATPAFAQQPPADQPPPEALQTEAEAESGQDIDCNNIPPGTPIPSQCAVEEGAITVTGTRIRRPNLESQVPITSISGESFIQQSSTSIGDTLNELPQLRSTFAQTNPGLGIGIAGDFAIPQRALLLPTGAGHLMWECVSLVTDEAVAALNARGGVDRIVISHPHFYSAMVEWSEALGGVPILLHEADLAPQRGEGQIAHVVAVDAHGAVAHVVEPGDERGERGLAGGFNSSIARLARDHANKLLAEGKTVKFLTVGRKGHDILKRQFADKIIETISYREVKNIGFAQANEVSHKVQALFAAGEFDVATLFYAKFNSVISQVPQAVQIIPAKIEKTEGAGEASSSVVYEYEPSEEAIVEDLLPRNISVQIFRAMLENGASFYGAQMSAMDNATRNAGEMINKLQLSYNRQRQAQITKELIENHFGRRGALAGTR